MTNLRVGIVLVVGFFLVAELLQWFRGIALPSPVLWAGGVFLAVASNWDRRAGIPFKWIDRWAALERLTELERSASAQPFHAPGSEVRSPDRR